MAEVEMTYTTETIAGSIRAAKMLIGSIQWSEQGGTDCTGWGVCPECGADDWRGHKDGCVVVTVLSQLDDAIEASAALLAERDTVRTELVAAQARIAELEERMYRENKL